MTALTAVLMILAACGEEAAPAEEASVEQVSAEEAAELLTASTDDLTVIDVRTPDEFAEGHIDGARNLDLEGGQFEAALADLDPDAGYLLYCATGNRSGQAARMMAEAGFSNVYDAGGFSALAEAGVPTSM